MKRNVRTAERLLLAGYGLILLFMFIQDLVPLGQLNDIAAVKMENSTTGLIITTLIGVIQIMMLIGLSLLFIGKHYPIWAKLWLIIHPSCILAGAIWSWWIPYLTGINAEAKIERYTAMFGDTHAFLPTMNGIVPNTLHTFFHFTLLCCIVLTIYICITDHKSKHSNHSTIQENRKHG
ncbi:hypothetical protein [Oceanobacillus massiliensis]|uniref:hypothetical protein n=1 Tax=Oceanobacillus massiliensis TaxID=1465765 RepID=UPI000287BCF5|nr:hypothetical protein [Oceanobacillus massiliensis]